MPDIKKEPVRINPVINNPFRVLAVFTLAVVTVIIAINAD